MIPDQRSLSHCPRWALRRDSSSYSSSMDHSVMIQETRFGQGDHGVRQEQHRINLAYIEREQLRYKRPYSGQGEDQPASVIFVERCNVDNLQKWQIPTTIKTDKKLHGGFFSLSL